MEFTCQIWHFEIKRTLFAGSRNCVALELCCGSGVWNIVESDSHSTSAREWVEFDSAEKELGQKCVDAGSLLQTDRPRETQGQSSDWIQFRLVICQLCVLITGDCTVVDQNRGSKQPVCQDRWIKSPTVRQQTCHLLDPRGTFYQNTHVGDVSLSLTQHAIVTYL